MPAATLAQPECFPATLRAGNQNQNLEYSKEPVVVSIYLNETTSHGECGYRSYKIAKYADVVFDSVQGCYNIWAWSGEGAKEKFNSSGYGCVNNPDKWTFEVNTATVKFVGP
jgi:hypothetical protein